MQHFVKFQLSCLREERNVTEFLAKHPDTVEVTQHAKRCFMDCAQCSADAHNFHKERKVAAS